MSLPGRVLLDEYRVIRPIARGAVATVYLALDAQGRPFAVKVFPEGYATRADREWQVGRALAHPNVNPVLERLDVDRYPAVLLAFAPGRRLSEQPAGPGGFPYGRRSRAGAPHPPLGHAHRLPRACGGHRQCAPRG